MRKVGGRKSEVGRFLLRSAFRASHSALALALGLLSTCAVPAFGQSSYPMLMSLKPIAVQIGATTEHEVSARYNLYGANQVLIHGAGVTAEVVPPEMKDAKPAEATPEKKPDIPVKKPEEPKIKLRFTVAADAVPGPRSFRVITPQGASTIGQLVLVRDPVTYEADKNDALADAQAVTLPATLCGAIE